MKRLLLFLSILLSFCGSAQATGPYNGTWVGTASYASAATGFGQCLNLTSSNYVTVSPDSSSSASWSVCARVKCSSGTSAVGLIVGLGGAGNADNITYSNGAIQFDWSSFNSFTTSSTGYADGNWHVVEMDYDHSSNTVYCFVDGSLVHSGSGNTSATEQLKQIGNQYGTELIDEVQWSNTTCYHTSNYTPATSPFSNTAANQDALYHCDGNVNDSNGAGVAAGTLSQTGISQTTAQVTTTAASSGSSPYTYQFERSTSSGGPYTNVGAASTSLVLNDSGLTVNTTYYYVCLVMDSASNTATSSQLAVTTLASGVKPVGFIGDSITFGYNLSSPSTMSPPNCMQRILSAMAANSGSAKTVVISNQGVTGSTTANWQPGQTDYVNAVAAFKSAGVTVVSIMLGTNDYLGSVTQLTYLANMGAICNDLVNTYGFKVVVNCVISFQASNPSLLVSYNTGLPTICNGSTILMGDQQANAIFWANGQSYPAANSLSLFGSDGEHPQSPQGAEILGSLWARVLGPIIGIPLGGSSGNFGNGKLS